MRLEQRVAQLLIKRKKTITIAESCTGGLLANRLTNIPGSSHFLKLGVIAYSNKAKSRLLKVPKTTLQKYGAVSQQAAIAMAKEGRNILKTDFGIGLTGIAGPTGATKSKPVGLTYIAISTKNEILCVKYLFKGNRVRIKSQATNQALHLILEFL